jgi:hypothetical protein
MLRAIFRAACSLGFHFSGFARHAGPRVCRWCGVEVRPLTKAEGMEEP